MSAFSAAATTTWARLSRFDESALGRVQTWRRAPLTRVMRSLSTLGNASSWTLVGVALAASGGAAAHHALLLGMAAGLATLFSQALKRTCRRPRPSTTVPGLTVLMQNPDAFSFPSGHTAAAVAVAVALAGHGSFLGPVALLFAVGVGSSRVYLAAHYPLDVVAGSLLGCIAGLMARALLG